MILTGNGQTVRSCIWFMWIWVKGSWSFIFNFLSEITSTVHEGENLGLVHKAATVRHLPSLPHPMQQSLLTESRGHMGRLPPTWAVQQLSGPESSTTHTLFPRYSSSLSQCFLVCPSRIRPPTDGLQKCLQWLNKWTTEFEIWGSTKLQ